MKKLVIAAVCSLAFFSILILNSPGNASGNLCFLCGSGSSCEQCVSASGSDTQADRQLCEQKGCKVSGYTSCSGAANINYCR